MPITDLPALNALRTRMQWHQVRQRVLAENVANSDTPNFRPRDLAEPDFDRAMAGQGGGLSMARTSAMHIHAVGDTTAFAGRNSVEGYEVRPAGNAVNLEDEMQKAAQAQGDYTTATTLYSKSLALLKTAIGK